MQNNQGLLQDSQGLLQDSQGLLQDSQGLLQDSQGLLHDSKEPDHGDARRALYRPLLTKSAAHYHQMLMDGVDDEVTTAKQQHWNANPQNDQRHFNLLGSLQWRNNFSRRSRFRLSGLRCFSCNQVLAS
jgi:hypothetical protein